VAARPGRRVPDLTWRRDEARSIDFSIEIATDGRRAASERHENRRSIDFSIARPRRLPPRGRATPLGRATRRIDRLLDHALSSRGGQGRD
jgi:hypothetical protein